MQAGLAYTYIHAGARKVDGNPHAPLSPDVKSRLQADVNVLYSEFVSLVAKRRKCSPESIRATEAAVFRGQDAVAVGLADAVGTLRQAAASGVPTMIGWPRHFRSRRCALHFS